MTIAKIIIESDDTIPVLVDGMSVRIFDTGGTFITSGVSDGAGEVNVDIPDDDYDLYFFKQGVSINNGMPQRITIDAADTDVPPNTFKIIVHVATLPEALDPRQLCVSGYLIGADGEPSKDGRLTLQPCRDTGVFTGSVLAPQHSIAVAPDENGYYEFKLLRNISYRAFFHFLETLLSLDPPELDVRTPDLPALGIGDLLFPLPVLADLEPEVLALVVGDAPDDSVALEVFYSDGSVRSKTPRYTKVSIVSDDESVAQAELVGGNKVIITPLSIGTANVTIEREILDNVYYDPAPAFVTETLVVTVT